MSKSFLKTVGGEKARAAAARVSNDIRSDVGELAKIFKEGDEVGANEKCATALVTRTRADQMHVTAAGSASASSQGVLLSGALKKRDGIMVKKWIDVYCELRENSLTCFSSADKTQILDTLVIDAGIEFTFTEKDKLPALIVKKASRGPAMMAKELCLGAETSGLRDRWAETLDMCCLKARSHVEARKMVQEEAAVRARAEAEMQRKALEDAARNRAARMPVPHPVHAEEIENRGGGATTFELDELDSVDINTLPPTTPFSTNATAPTTSRFAAIPDTPAASAAAADTPIDAAANPVLEPSMLAEVRRDLSTVHEYWPCGSEAR